MKQLSKKMSPTFLIASVLVTISLFVLLSMLFYGPSDYLEQGAADKSDSYYGFRYTVASAFFSNFGIGAYVGWMIILAWAVIVFFRETVGDLAIRGISLVVVVVSGAALAELLGSENYLGGSLGYAVGTVLRSGFGTVLGVILIGAVFTVALVLATDFGFVSYYKEARGALAVVEREEEPEIPEAPMDLISRMDQTIHEIEAEDEAGDAFTEAGEEEPEAEETEAESSAEIEPPETSDDEGSKGRPIVIDLRPTIEEEDLDEELATSGETEPEAPIDSLVAAAGPIIETEPEVELAGPEKDEIEADEDTRILLDTAIGSPEDTSAGDFEAEDEEPTLATASLEPDPLEEVEAATMTASLPPRSADEALESVFDALVGSSELDAREEELMRSAVVVVEDGGVVVAEPPAETEEAAEEAPVEAEIEEVLEAEVALEPKAAAPVAAEREQETEIEVQAGAEAPMRPILEDMIIEEALEEEETAEAEDPVAGKRIPEERITEETPVAETVSEPELVLDDAVYIMNETVPAEEPAEATRPAPEAEAPEAGQVIDEVRVEAPTPLPEPEALPEAAPEEQQVILLDDELTLSGAPDEAEDTLLPFMQEEREQAEAVEATGEPVAPAAPAETAVVAESEPEDEIPVLEDVPEKGMFRSLFTRKKTPRTASVADPLLDHAAEMVIERGRASVVLLQRRLDIGYTRAARIIEALEAEGLVGPMTESGSREILLTVEGWRERK